MSESSKISDFLLPYRILQIVCHQIEADFVDLSVEFSQRDSPDFNYHTLYLPVNTSLNKNLFSMVSLYISYIDTITGVSINDNEKRAIINYALSCVRGLGTDLSNPMQEEIESNGNESFLMRLDQFPMVWSLLKDIICPSAMLEFTNEKIVAGHSAVVDACVHVDEKEKKLTQNKGSFIFVNLDVASSAVRDAFLLYECLYASCGSDEQISQILFSTLSNFFLKEKLVDYVRMCMDNDEEASLFFTILSILTTSEDLERVAFEIQNSGDAMQRTAQMETNWWFLGLTEKMLEPARSEDWSVYETWKEYTDQLWSRVEEQRRLRGLDEVPFEMLLRIQSDDRSIDKPAVLQELLSDERIW